MKIELDEKVEAFLDEVEEAGGKDEKRVANIFSRMMIKLRQAEREISRSTSYLDYCKFLEVTGFFDVVLARRTLGHTYYSLQVASATLKMLMKLIKREVKDEKMKNVLLNVVDDARNFVLKAREDVIESRKMLKKMLEEYGVEEEMML